MPRSWNGHERSWQPQKEAGPVLSLVRALQGCGQGGCGMGGLRLGILGLLGSSGERRGAAGSAGKSVSLDRVWRWCRGNIQEESRGLRGDADLGLCPDPGLTVYVKGVVCEMLMEAVRLTLWGHSLLFLP